MIIIEHDKKKRVIRVYRKGNPNSYWLYDRDSIPQVLIDTVEELNNREKPVDYLNQIQEFECMWQVYVEYLVRAVTFKKETVPYSIWVTDKAKYATELLIPDQLAPDKIIDIYRQTGDLLVPIRNARGEIIGTAPYKYTH